MSAARVLLVDDDPLFTRRAELALGTMVDVRVARTQRDALTTAESWRPDAVVVDVMLTDSDAFRLLEELRSRVGGQLAVICLTKGPGSRTWLFDDGVAFFGVMRREAGIDTLQLAVARAVGLEPTDLLVAS